MTDIWDEMTEMQQRMDDLLGRVFGRRSRGTLPGSEMVRQPFVPTTDTYDKDGDLIVRVELPGVDPAKDVHVFVDDGDLVIRGERKEREEVKEDSYYRMEASYGSFERRLAIPKGIDEDAIEADYTDGVLRVRVPKAAREITPPKAKEIPVRSGKAIKAA